MSERILPFKLVVQAAGYTESISAYFGSREEIEKRVRSLKKSHFIGRIQAYEWRHSEWMGLHLEAYDAPEALDKGLIFRTGSVLLTSLAAGQPANLVELAEVIEQVLEAAEFPSLPFSLVRLAEDREDETELEREKEKEVVPSPEPTEQEAIPWKPSPWSPYWDQKENA